MCKVIKESRKQAEDAKDARKALRRLGEDRS